VRVAKGWALPFEQWSTLGAAIWQRMDQWWAVTVRWRGMLTVPYVAVIVTV